MAAPPVRPKKRNPQQPTVNRRRHIPQSLCNTQPPAEDAWLLDANAVSVIVGIPAKTLSDWRYRNRHLPYYRLGHHVRYDAQDVAAFLTLHREEIDPKNVLTAREVAALGRHLEKIRNLLAAHPELTALMVVERGGLAGKWR
jgi:hypothetical protein